MELLDPKTRMELLAPFAEHFDISKFPYAFDHVLEKLQILTTELEFERKYRLLADEKILQLQEELCDRNKDLEFEYNGRVAAEKKVEELDVKISQLKTPDTRAEFRGEDSPRNLASGVKL